VKRYEYIDYEGNAHTFSAPDFASAVTWVEAHEYDRTASFSLADRAAGTVELSDERSRAA